MKIKEWGTVGFGETTEVCKILGHVYHEYILQENSEEKIHLGRNQRNHQEQEIRYCY